MCFFSLFSLVGFSTLLNCSYTQNCTKKPCVPNARCEIRNGAEGCYCNIGFSGNGVSICEGKQSLLPLLEHIIRFNFDVVAFAYPEIKLSYFILFDFMLLIKKKKHNEQCLTFSGQNLYLIIHFDTSYILVLLKTVLELKLKN